MSTNILRTRATCRLPGSLHALRAASHRPSLTSKSFKAALSSARQPSRSSPLLSLAIRHPVQKSLVRYQTNWGLDLKAEAEYAKQKIQAVPEVVSTESTIHNVTSETATPPPEEDVDMMEGIRNDFNTIKETFSLRDVPRPALYVGLAGVVPYLATSLTTVGLALDIQYSAMHGQGFLLSGEVAEKLLHVIEPIQLGYGATIISFLGAIHWGLEWAGYGGYQEYNRYAIGIVATAVAWPTLLLSAEVGLITQFLAFTFLYYADARAARAGWAPSWYGTYRFVLTFVVGASIVASLIGRGQIADLITHPPGPADRMHALRETQMAELEAQYGKEGERASADSETEGEDGEEEGEDGEDGEKEEE